MLFVCICSKIKRFFVNVYVHVCLCICIVVYLYIHRCGCFNFRVCVHVAVSVLVFINIYINILSNTSIHTVHIEISGYICMHCRMPMPKSIQEYT